MSSKLELSCLEWLNVNKNARLLKTKKKSPAASQQNENNNSPVYLLKIVGNRLNSSLACLSSDRVVHVFDQTSLKSTFSLRNAHDSGSNINEIGFFNQNEHMLFTAGDDGCLKCWDMRQSPNKKDSAVVCFSYAHLEEPAEDVDEARAREFLCADVNADDGLFVVGTNKCMEDALVYVFDVRHSNRYKHKFRESHSNDLSQLRFQPESKSKFASASIDGLVCLYDLNSPQNDTTNKKKSSASTEPAMRKGPNERAQCYDETDDEDDDLEDADMVYQTFNTNSSVQKIGYLNKGNTTDPDQMYAITFTNDLFVWDLNSHDLVYRSPKCSKITDKNRENGAIKKKEDEEEDDDEEQEEDDYFFECFYFRRDEHSQRILTTCMADKSGIMSLYQENQLVFKTRTSTRTAEDDEEERERRKHREAIRGSFWNGEALFTAGEDGFLFKWKLSEKEEESKKSKALLKRKNEEATTDKKQKSAFSNSNNKNAKY